MITLFDYTSQVEFCSSATIEDCVRKLKAITEGTPAWKSTLVGRVDKEQVVLHRSRAWTGNWYKPFFYGRFYNVGGKTILKGKFSLSKFMRVSFIIQSVIVGFVAIIIPLSAIGQNSVSQLLIWFLFLIIVIALGIPMMALIKRFSSDDVDWISNNVKSALGQSS